MSQGRFLDAIFGSTRGRVPYEIIPTSIPVSSQAPPAPYLARRCFFAARRRLRICALIIVAIVTASAAAATYVLNYPMPPLYTRFHQAELALPQHDASLQFPEGGNGKYLWIANHASRGDRILIAMPRRQTECGWGNAMQELFLNAYLAYKTDRAFVFDNYTWSRDESDYSLYNLKPIPSRIPLTALIQGPIVGGEWPSGSTAPRAVVPEYFYEVCPKQERTMISSRGVNDLLSDPSANTLIQAWTTEVTPHRCVEIERAPPEIFNEHVFADASLLLDIWPDFSRSPIVQDFSWSTLVELAFDNNREVISPTSPFDPTLSSSSASGLARYSTIPGLLVLHIRRGDFQSHCHDVLARRSIGYTGFNSFPDLPDHWHLPSDISDSERRASYTRHCFPDIDMIVERVEDARRSEAGRGLSQIYVMTNGSPSWVSKLRSALREKHDWAHIASSRDLMLNPEQRYVAQAIDMLVAQRAQVFVGNGFSTLSGMVVMLRMANGMQPNHTRHW